MKIHGRKLKKMVSDKEISPEQLAAAIARKGLSQAQALAALTNWMRGNDHPRCTAADIQALARELTCRVGEIALFTCVYKYHRGSPRKVKLVTDLIRGKKILEAENNLRFTTKRAAVDVLKALQAAIEDARLAEADQDALVVSDSRVDAGPTMKRFQPKDRGRAHPIMKRMSHITVGVEERN